MTHEWMRQLKLGGVKEVVGERDKKGEEKDLPRCTVSVTESSTSSYASPLPRAFTPAGSAVASVFLVCF